MTTLHFSKVFGRVLHARVQQDVNMAFSTEIDHWPVSLQVRMCPPERPAAKDTPLSDRAAMNDDILGNKFRADLRTHGLHVHMTWTVL